MADKEKKPELNVFTADSGKKVPMKDVAETMNVSNIIKSQRITPIKRMK